MSLTERPINAAQKTMLVNNEPHEYAHLIKFERPSLPNTNGEVSTSAVRYTYITDASINVSFDDGSTDNDGNANGTQVYLANKVLKVGAITERTEAQAGTTSIVLDGNAIGAYANDTVTIATVSTGIWDITWPLTTKPLNEGFREGDKVQIVYDDASPTVTVNIHSFRSGNVVRVTKIDDNMTTGSKLIEMSLTSEEIVSVLSDKSSASYASFINREVDIYRTHFQNGSIVGTPSLIFRGIISAVSFEDNENSINVSWGLTDHWGDFSKVKSRLTSDQFHRALDIDGIPQLDSALKPAYAYDKGFAHSENSINMLAKYVVQVEKQKIKVKTGFLGIGAKTKIKTYLVPEDRYTDLDFQLQAKALPVIYGVRAIEEPIAIFADTLANDSSEVYVLYALCEGEIGGLYDVIINGNSLICNDKADYDARSEQTSDNTVELICYGRADAGDVLSASTVTDAGTPTNYYTALNSSSGLNFVDLTGIVPNFITDTNFNSGVVRDSDVNTGSFGVLGGEVISMTDPQEIEIEVFTGTSGQKASNILTEIAAANNFKIQQDYWDNLNKEEYWGPNHRLLDTAYVLVKVKIAEGEETLPELKFIVRAKIVDCYNYDYSYEHYSIGTGSEDSDNFVLGETVSLYKSSDNSLLVSNTQIIDKWTFQNPDGTPNVRFRWATEPDLELDDNDFPTITKFYMKDASLNTWTMCTFNHEELSGTVPATIASTVTSISNSSGFIRFNYTSNTDMAVEGDPNEDSPLFSVVDPTTYEILTGNGILSSLILLGTVSSTSLTTKYNYFNSLIQVPLGNFAASNKLASRNTIKLPASASGTNDYYVGMDVTVSSITSEGKKTTQTEKIIGYNGTSKIATIESLWNAIPQAGDAISIKSGSDRRFSINPAIQLLDYVKSPIYGRGLDISKNINLPSWLESGRLCDERSDVTIKYGTTPTVTPTEGAIYRYPSSGNIIWQGEVSNVSNGYITFTNVIGKLTNKWNSWKYWNTNELVYNGNELRLIGTPGVTADVATFESNSSTGTRSITKVSGTGDSSISLDATLGNPVRNERDGKDISGYSLYDSDGVDYWRLCGWDEHSQRYATRYQTNVSIDTANPVFENTNSFLQHFGGILRYTSGKYYLDVERQEAAISPGDIRLITEADIIGKIQLSDEGVRNSFNSLTSSYPDPSNNFEAANISFFNSDFLKADRNVPKKGNLSLPGMTNYYTTRIIADSFLNKSRFGLTINFTMRHVGYLFLAGTVFQLSYSRYNWDNKPFRIESITYQPDGLVDIVAKEYDDSFYSATSVNRSSGAGRTNKTRRIVSVSAPTNLVVTSDTTLDEVQNGIELTWTNSPNATTTSTKTEVYGSFSPHMKIHVTDIASDVLTVSETAHGLVAGMPIYSLQAYQTDELINEGKYYVREVLSDTTFTLSLDKKNLVTPGTLPDIVSLTDGTSLTLQFMTAELLGTVDVPGNKFVDNAVSEGTGRVDKYYWIRHKVIT